MIVFLFPQPVKPSVWFDTTPKGVSPLGSSTLYIRGQPPLKLNTEKSPISGLSKFKYRISLIQSPPQTQATFAEIETQPGMRMIGSNDTMCEISSYCSDSGEG